MPAPIIPILAWFAVAAIGTAIVVSTVTEIDNLLLENRAEEARAKIRQLRRRKGGKAFRDIYEKYKQDMSPKTRAEFRRWL